MFDQPKANGATIPAAPTMPADAAQAEEVVQRNAEAVRNSRGI